MSAELDFNVDSLGGWLGSNIQGFKSPFVVTRFSGGQSNPTYKITAHSGNYVLRRKPYGDILPSAHAVDREFRLISALYPMGYPTAKPYALCEDTQVIGAIFYIMDFVDGMTFWDGALPDLSSTDRQSIYFNMIDGLADLHNLDYLALGLESFGKSGNYFERQIERWTKQYRASQTDDIKAMEDLITFLPKAVPAQTRTSIVHGDYRIDNLIFSKHTMAVAGVLDWELATIGDPMADFTYLMMNWVLPYEGQAGIAGLDSQALGLPSLEDAVARYCQKTNREGVVSLDWYFAYNLFRVAAIIQGIKKRFLTGNASSEKAELMARRVGPLSEVALEYANKCA